MPTELQLPNHFFFYKRSGLKKENKPRTEIDKNKNIL